MRSDDLLLPWLESLRADIPELELFDAHTHIGQSDPDGYTCSPDELLAALAMADARGVVFAMHEPGGYPEANDRVLAAARGSDGRLVALCRVDPDADPAGEAERSLDAGAAGIKLHPRAESFTLDHDALDDLFALANERGVPVLVHAGRGIPALGRHALEACERFPALNLILAHAGICDLAWIWRESPAHPNLFFDTSWWSPDDLMALFALVPPGQILFGSDAPYGTPVLGAVLALRCAIQTGVSEDGLQAVAGGQLTRLLSGAAPLDLGPAPGTARLAKDPLLDRVHGFLMSATGQMLAGIVPGEVLALAELACEVGEDAPQAEVCRSVVALMREREGYRPKEGERPPPRFAPGIHLIVLAATITRTPDVRLPELEGQFPVTRAG